MDKNERLIKANELIKIISEHGRRFFFYKGKIGFFSLNEKTGKLFWNCEYSGKSIYLSYKYWTFTHGGTLHAFINALKKYIDGKSEFPINHLGPWPKFLCDGDLWGYGLEEMAMVREKATILMHNVVKEKIL